MSGHPGGSKLGNLDFVVERLVDDLDSGGVAGIAFSNPARESGAKGRKNVTAWGGVAGLLGDDFEDIDYLGRGSSGVVYRATQRSLGRTVAVKVFRRFAEDETADRVLAEARAQAQLSWHSNVVSLYGQGMTSDGFPYLIMEYAPGGSLASRVRDRGPLPEREWTRLCSELLAAVASAHDGGVLHCDVKPSNVLFAADGSARLADFGIAKANGMATGTIDSIEGSLGYVAPELLDGEKPQPAGDVYSLALTLAYALNGEPPLDDDLTIAQAVAAVHAGVPTACASWHGCPEGVEHVLRMACSVDPDARPSASEIAQVLRADSDPGSSTTTDRSSRSSVRVLTVGAVIAVVALFGMVLVRSPGPGIEPVAATTKAFDLCAEYESYVRDREELISDVSTELELSASPVTVARRLLHDYPFEFAALSKPFIDALIAADLVSGEVTSDQLANVVVAQNLRVLAGGKPFLYDGEVGSFEPVGLPTFLFEPARIFSEANRVATRECPQVTTDFAARKARLSSAIYSNLSNPRFMDGFFADPESYDVFDARTALLVATYAWFFFDEMLMSHPQWFFEMMDRHDDVRRVISIEHPEALLQIVASNPDLVDKLTQQDWKADLQEGLDLINPVMSLGVVEMYGPLMEELGLVIG